jgi:hypothetical protein
MAMTPEGRVKAAVKKWLQMKAAWFFLPVSNGMGKHGIPDVIACMPVTVTPEMVGMTIGVFFAPECKALGRRSQVTDRQLQEIEGIRAAGGVAGVVDAVSQLDEMFVQLFAAKKSEANEVSA